MYSDRKILYKKLEENRNSKVLVYITGDRRGMEAQISGDALDFFPDHLDTFNDNEKISLILYSRGGNTLSGWTIVNLIRQFCSDFEVIIPSKAHSTATLISLGANKIIMTKQSTLGPIDPSINSALNPHMPGAPENVRVPVSVEAIAGFFDLARQELEIKKSEHLNEIFLKLTEQVHPLALGDVYRARTQIQRLAERLLKYHLTNQEKITKIISILCSESGSHDYTINRNEAKDDLFLPIEKPDDELYNLIKSIYIDIRNELVLTERFDPGILVASSSLANYSNIRALIESATGGSDRFISEGQVEKTQVNTPAGPQEAIQDRRTFEGWRHEK